MCLFISKWPEIFKTARRGIIRNLESISRDEKGMLEPQAELLSTALAVIGFVVFAVILSQAYFGYEERSFALENYESSSLLVQAVAQSSALKAENSNLLSASTLDKLAGPSGTLQRDRLFAPFSANYLFLVEIKTGDGKWHWKIIPNDFQVNSLIGEKEKLASSIPVVIELNPAEAVPGTLTVIVYNAEWK
ncbi:MAG: hypothetical protein ACPK85_00495 [Methanosarcina sp.]